MLRGDDIISGTSSTGTGNLTLISPPAPPGGLDFDTWALALGFTSGAVIPVSYTVEEYTSSAFTTAKGKGKGVGTYTVGSKILTRTTPQYSITGMDGATPAFSISGAYSIVTAANTLVYIGASAADIGGISPYFSTTGVDTNWGTMPEGECQSVGAAFQFSNTNYDCYIPIKWRVPMLVKRCSFRVNAYSTVVGSPVISVRLYGIGSDGRPGKLLYDFTPSAGVAITGTGAYSTGASGSGILLLPADYYIDFAFTGFTSGTLTMLGGNPGYYCSNPAAIRLGNLAGIVYGYYFSGGATAGAGPDPANLFTWGQGAANSPWPVIFGLSPT